MIKITPEMGRYIQLQRTGIKGDICGKFERSLMEDFYSIKDYLPLHCNKILDIGSGLGGIDLFLYIHYKCQNICSAFPVAIPELHLLDYDKCDTHIYYGYQKSTSAYSSLSLAREFLKMNGIDKKKIGLHDAEDFRKIIPADIIISLISCGFHYPFRIYMDYIKKCRKGIVIMDIRKNSDQFNCLLENFGTIQIIKEFEKYYRILIK